MGFFGVDLEKVARWRAEGKVSKLRGAVEEGGEVGEAALAALAALVAEPAVAEGVGDQATVEAFDALWALDQHAAAEAVQAHAANPAARVGPAGALIGRLAAAESEAALVALFRVAAGGVGRVAERAAAALTRFAHPRFDEEMRRALLWSELEVFERLVPVLHDRRVPGAVPCLVRRWPETDGPLRWAVARALVRHGFGAVEAQDPELAAYLAAEVGQYGRAAALGAAAWRPLAETLGPVPSAGERTQAVLAALAQVDGPRLLVGLRARLLRALEDAWQRPRQETLEAARREAAWVLPGLAQVYGLRSLAREVGHHVAAERFRAAQGLLESL